MEQMDTDFEYSASNRCVVCVCDWKLEAARNVRLSMLLHICNELLFYIHICLERDLELLSAIY